MFIYAVLSYKPSFVQAKVRVDGIYNTFEEASARQEVVCEGCYPHFIPGIQSGLNGSISWIKKIKMGDHNRLDMYAPNQRDENEEEASIEEASIEEASTEEIDK